MPFEDFIAAGLYDPDAPGAQERREYLEYLLAQGFSVEEICDVRHVLITDVLAVLHATRRRFISATEVAQRTGMSPAKVDELRTILGLPLKSLENPEIADTFVDDIALYQVAMASYGEERTLAFARALGAAIASLIEAGRELTWAHLRDVPMTELEVALANDAAFAAWQALPDLIGHLMMERASRDIWFEEELRSGPVSMAVAFVDLVGSTDWTARLSVEDHAAALNRFEDMAVRQASRHASRVVKFIGDEAMLVGSDVASVVSAAVGLCAAIDQDDVLPIARGAVGWGRVTPRGGDYFGEVVNLVGRATKHAPNGGVVATTGVSERLDPSEWAIGTPRATALRGIDGTVELVDVARK